MTPKQVLEDVHRVFGQVYEFRVVQRRNRYDSYPSQTKEPAHFAAVSDAGIISVIEAERSQIWFILFSVRFFFYKCGRKRNTRNRISLDGSELEHEKSIIDWFG